MSYSYMAKEPIALGRQLKVQKLSIPFTIVGSATAANVVISCDEPSLMFIKTAGVDQISAALPSGDSASYSVSPDDSNGIFNVFIKVGEKVEKIVDARCKRRSNVVANSTEQVVALGSASGLSALQNIMLTIDSDVALNASNTLDASLEVEYVIQES